MARIFKVLLRRNVLKCYSDLDDEELTLKYNINSGFLTIRDEFRQRFQRE